VVAFSPTVKVLSPTDVIAHSGCVAGYTSTSNRWVAVSPPLSLAVTLTVASPSRSPLNRTVLPSTETLATALAAVDAS